MMVNTTSMGSSQEALSSEEQEGSVVLKDFLRVQAVSDIKVASVHLHKVVMAASAVLPNTVGLEDRHTRDSDRRAASVSEEWILPTKSRWIHSGFSVPD